MTTNSYYVPSGEPSTGAFAASAPMRSEFDMIAAGFDLLPTLSAGAASRAVVVASNGLSLTTTTGTLALAGNFATTGAFAVTLAAGAIVTLTLPLVSGTLATLAGTETLTNKTLTSPTMTNPVLGTVASGDLSACTGTAPSLNVGHATTADSVTTNANLTGPITSIGNATSVASQTGTGSTFVMNTSPTLVTPTLGVATATSLNGLTVTSTTGALTLTNGKTLSVAKTLTLDGTDGTTMTFPTTSATIARTDAGQTFTGVQVMTSPSITTPAFTGAFSGTYSLGGTPTINVAAAVGGTWTAAATWTLPALTLGGTVSGGGNQINNVVIGASSAGAGTFTTLVATTVNGNTITTGTGVLTLGAGKTLTASNTLTLTATDGSTLAIGGGGTLASAAYKATGTSGNTVPLLDGANTWSAAQTMSAALTYGGVTLTNAVTGTGKMVLDTSPTLATPNLGTPSAINLANATNVPLPSLTPITDSISGDVSLNNTSNYIDGPSVAQGSTGTWFAYGTVTLQDTTAGLNAFKVKLWDGTTVIDSTFAEVNGSTNNVVVVSLGGFLASPAGNLRISVNDQTTTAGKILANASGLSKDSTITAFRVA